MDAEESRENHPNPEDETPKIPPELLKVKMEALSKATARKKEIGLIKKAEKMKKNEELDARINQAKEVLQQKALPVIEVKPKKTKKIIEKVIEEESSSEEEVIERIIIKKKNKSKPKYEDDDEQVITQTNKELLQKKLKEEQRKKLMADLFSY